MLTGKRLTRFWERVQRGAPDECWPWTGGKLPSGYGKLQHQNKEVYAHRTVYELTKGPIPAGLHICHTCDNPPCCNPTHLWAGTVKENMQDRDRKRRGCFSRPGYIPHNLKFTADQIRAIRQAYTGKYGQLQAIANDLGVHRNTIRHIVKGRNRKGVV